MTDKKQLVLDALIDAVEDVLYDIGTDDGSPCLAVKAKLRLAYEPFLTHEESREYIMTLEEAVSILNDCGLL
jgi:hypothetical protein